MPPAVSRWLELQIGAQIPDHAHLQAEHGAVALEGQLGRHHLVAPLIRGDEILAARGDPLDRAGRAKRQMTGQRVFLVEECLCCRSPPPTSGAMTRILAAQEIRSRRPDPCARGAGSESRAKPSDLPSVPASPRCLSAPSPAPPAAEPGDTQPNVMLGLGANALSTSPPVFRRDVARFALYPAPPGERRAWTPAPFSAFHDRGQRFIIHDEWRSSASSARARLSATTCRHRECRPRGLPARQQRMGRYLHAGHHRDRRAGYPQPLR